MQDKIGTTIELNDMVIYTSGGRGDYNLNIGVIIKIDDSDDTVLVKEFKTNRRQSKYRNSNQILSLKPYESSNPEFFI